VRLFPGMPQIVEVDAGQACGLQGRKPDSPPEVAPAQWCPVRAGEDEIIFAA